MNDQVEAFCSLLRDSSQKLQRCWDRIGVPAATRDEHFAALVKNQLTPSLQNLVRLFETEEMQLRREIERLVRDVAGLSDRLEEPLANPKLRDIMASSSSSTSSSSPSTSPSRSSADPSPTLERLFSSYDDFSQITEALKKELTRLEGVAEWRVELLVLLHKQRAILLQPFSTQHELRAAYANKFLATDVDVEHPTVEGDDRSHRRTIFEADTNDVVLLGKRQDLTIRRISEESESVLGEIAASNARMREMLNEENVLIAALWRKLQSSDAEKLLYQEGIESLEKQLAAGGGLREEYTDSVLLEQMPEPLTRILLVKTVAPILEYAVALRRRLQQDYFDVHVEKLGQLSSLINDRHRRYFEFTEDTSYAVPADYTVWLDEVIASSSTAGCSALLTSGGGAGVSSAPLSPCVSARPYLALMSDVLSSSQLSVVESRIEIVLTAIARAEKELGHLDDRIKLLETASPLIRRRNEIISQKQQCEDGGRERLLSKKPNAARQLLAEETARKLVAKELPRVNTELDRVCREWHDLTGNPLSIHGHFVQTTSGSQAPSAACSQKNSGQDHSVAKGGAGLAPVSPRPQVLSQQRTNTPPPPVTPLAKKRRLDAFALPSTLNRGTTSRGMTTPHRSTSQATRTPPPK